jgi:hypothetical protein
MKLIPVFKLKVIYKSGAEHTFEVYKFTVKDGTYTWWPVSDHNKPIVIGATDIAAVWQVGARHVLQWKNTPVEG